MNSFHYKERKPPRVLSHPVRDPVNMQAVRIIRPAAWYEQAPPTNPNMEIDTLKKENAKMKATNASLALQCAALQKQVNHFKKLHEEADKKLAQSIADREKQVADMVGEEKAHANRVLNKVKVFHSLEMADKTLDRLIIKVIPE